MDVDEELYKKFSKTSRWPRAAQQMSRQLNRKASGREVTELLAGRDLRARFLKATPALKQLSEAVKDTAKTRGYLKGIDGRRLHVRSQHSALNTLLQSAGAVAVKLATAIIADKCKVLDPRIQQVGHFHDEVQIEVPEGLEEEVGAICVESFEEAGQILGFQCPLTGEYKVGRTWAETH